MRGIDELMLTIDELLDTKHKRHIVGGILLSTSLFFGGLAFTVMTMKETTKERSLLLNEK